MTPRMGAGGVAILLAALFPAACLQTVVLPPPPEASGDGGTGGLAVTTDAGIGGTPDGAGDRGVALCGQATRISHATPTVMFTLDHSTSMMTTPMGSGNRTRLEVVQDTIRDLVGQYGSTRVKFGYLEFPQASRQGCGMNSCCIGDVTLPSLTNANSIFEAVMKCAPDNPNPSSSCLGPPESNSTSTVQALAQVLMTLNVLDLNPREFNVLLTDHEPASCGSSGDPCGDAAIQINKLDSTRFDNMNMVARWAVPTYVVAVGDSIANDTDSCLNQMAQASRVMRPRLPHYYAGTTGTLVGNYLSTMVTQAICYVQVDDPPFDTGHSNNLDVYIDNQLIPHDGNNLNGWNFGDLTNGRQGIMFFGTMASGVVNGACDAFLRATDANQVQRIRVCPR